MRKYIQESNFPEIIDIMGTDVPVEISSRISTKKINFILMKLLMTQTITMFFEAEFALNISVNGTFSVAGFTQAIPILETQDVMKVTYFYANNIGLIREQKPVKALVFHLYF